MSEADHKSILGAIVDGVSEADDALDSVDMVLENIAKLLVDLKAKGEASGHDPNVVMDRLDDIVKVLQEQQFKIVQAVAENTDLDG